MPEIGEVARIVHYIHKHLVGKTLAVVKAQHDEKVFGAVGTSAAEFEKNLVGKKVESAGQQGKYFWMIMSSPPHPVCHFGMAGWLKIRHEETAYYKPSKPEEPNWPPEYWKFILETTEEPKCEAAFVDFRRFARVRLVDCAAESIRHVTPLKENGPDPVIDRDIVTEEWLAAKLGSKKIPIKALLLNQANISGIGNWVGDEILYHARIHPEQYSNTLSSPQISQLYESLHYVTTFAVDNLADSSKFPESWMFKHRWGKGKKDHADKMANGAKIEFLKVGGRTSAIVPSVQKKTGKVAGDVKTREKDNSNNDNDDYDNNDDDDDEDAEDESGKNPIPTPKKPKTPSKKPSKPKTKPETKPKEPKPEPSSTEKKKPTPEPTSSTLPHRRSQKASRAKPDDPLSSHLTDTKATTADHDNPPPVSSKKRTATGAKIEADASHETPASKKAKDGHAQPGRRRSARVSSRG